MMYDLDYGVLDPVMVRAVIPGLARPVLRAVHAGIVRDCIQRYKDSSGFRAVQLILINS